jgi:CRP-like cAMP-binding protein
MFRERDFDACAPMICQGWAAVSSALADGRKQILAFLLPGDIVSTTLLFEPTTHCMVEAITDVEYRTFEREDFERLIFNDPELVRTLSKSWVTEKLTADRLAVDLGRRSAHERIARLIHDLTERLVARGMERGQPMDFPLRQHHIADATGLTPVHVSKVLTEFRRDGLIEIGDRTITILNPPGLHRMATLR